MAQGAYYIISNGEAAIIDPLREIQPYIEVIDVRKQSEYSAEQVDQAYHRPLSDINDWINSIDSKEHFYLHCAGGYRSKITASILHARG